METPLTVNVPVVGVVRSPAVLRSASALTRPRPTEEVTEPVPLLKSSACCRKSLVSEPEPRTMGDAELREILPVVAS